MTTTAGHSFYIGPIGFFYYQRASGLIFSSETTWPNGTKLGSKHLCKVLYKVSPFRSIWATNMVAKINSFFWLANVKKIFSSETAWPNGAKLGIDGPWVCPFQNCVRQPHPPFKMAAVFKGNDYLPLKFASVSFYCQVSDTGSVGWASSFISSIFSWFHRRWTRVISC